MLENFLLAPEHLHPLVTHFPIAFWLIGAVLYWLSMIGRLSGVRGPAILMGVLGTGFGWLATETGERAEHIVSKALCNKELLEQHASQAETTLIFFAASWAVALVFHLAYGRFAPERDVPTFIRALVSLGLLLGSAFLVVAGHKGFKLVYEEGAGVRAPIQTCASGEKSPEVPPPAHPR